MSLIQPGDIFGVCSRCKRRFTPGFNENLGVFCRCCPDCQIRNLADSGMPWLYAKAKIDRDQFSPKYIWAASLGDLPNMSHAIWYGVDFMLGWQTSICGTPCSTDSLMTRLEVADDERDGTRPICPKCKAITRRKLRELQTRKVANHPPDGVGPKLS